MNDKLLRAFIEAQGFEIKEVTKEYIETGGSYLHGWERSGVRVIDYKVTKKEVDYKEVLSKYIRYVEYREGTNFLNDADNDDFTPKELKAIKELANV